MGALRRRRVASRRDGLAYASPPTFSSHSGRTSSGAGRWPPSLDRMWRAVCPSARARRWAKKSAVFIADNFSATATVTNWLMLAPSSRLASATAFLSDAGSRSGKVTVCLLTFPASSRHRPDSAGRLRTEYITSGARLRLRRNAAPAVAPAPEPGPRAARGNARRERSRIDAGAPSGTTAGVFGSCL